MHTSLELGTSRQNLTEISGAFPSHESKRLSAKLSDCVAVAGAQFGAKTLVTLGRKKGFTRTSTYVHVPGLVLPLMTKKALLGVLSKSVTKATPYG